MPAAIRRRPGERKARAGRHSHPAQLRSWPPRASTSIPRVGTQAFGASRRPVSNSDTQSEGQLMAAFFEGGKDLSEEEMAVLWQDAKDYIQWKLSQRRKAKDDQ